MWWIVPAYAVLTLLVVLWHKRSQDRLLEAVKERNRLILESLEERNKNIFRNDN